MRIGFDFNGVVINNTVTKSRVAKEFFGVDLKAENAFLRTLDGALPPENYEVLQDIVYGTSEMLTSPPLSEMGRTRLARLMRRNEVFLVTRIQAAGVQFAKQWLREHWLKDRGLISVGPGGDKERVLRHGFDAYVDDDLEQLASLESVVSHLFLLDAPYNRSEALPASIVRVSDWQELEERIEGIAHSSPAWRAGPALC